MDFIPNNKAFLYNNDLSKMNYSHCCRSFMDTQHGCEQMAQEQTPSIKERLIKVHVCAAALEGV